MRLRRAWQRMRVHGGEEGGYTMIAVIGAISLVSMLAAATLAATNGDINLVKYDLDHRRAHAAAQAGIADYSFHLNNDNSYWARCTEVPSPNAVNQVNSTASRRSVPGPSGEEYAIEMLPATGKSSCNPADPLGSMLEQSGPNTGSFRIRSNGYAGKAKASLVATYKRASLLDYVYFTQFETLDPITFAKSSWLQSAYDHCEQFIREGRQSTPIPGSGGKYCEKIVFTAGDDIDGPLHTNDALVIMGNPSFGRNAADVTEVSAPPLGWHKCSDLLPATTCLTPQEPKFVGPFVTTAPVLTPPATNGRLEDIAETSGSIYSCQTTIELKGTTMDVTTNTGGKVTGVPFPTSGVVYVREGSCPDKGGVAWPSCSSGYSPFTATYPSGSDCGTVRVKGNYSGQLTIAAQKDIVIEGDIERSGTGLLGLIANNSVRIKHPFCRQKSGASEGCPSGWIPAQIGPGECNGGSNKGSLSDLTIEAAILAIDHSFIVDHFDCGASLGELEVNGAISQKFRGPVGRGSAGYIKDYNYDDRLRYMEPPHFLNPVEPSWHIQRETLDFG